MVASRQLLRWSPWFVAVYQCSRNVRGGWVDQDGVCGEGGLGSVGGFPEPAQPAVGAPRAGWLSSTAVSIRCWSQVL